MSGDPAALDATTRRPSSSVNVRCGSRPRKDRKLAPLPRTPDGPAVEARDELRNCGSCVIASVNEAGAAARRSLVVVTVTGVGDAKPLLSRLPVTMMSSEPVAAVGLGDSAAKSLLVRWPASAEPAHSAVVACPGMEAQSL